MEEAVLRTEEAWDDALLNAAESRAYGLYFIGALNLALIGYTAEVAMWTRIPPIGSSVHTY